MYFYQVLCMNCYEHTQIHVHIYLIHVHIYLKQIPLFFTDVYHYRMFTNTLPMYCSDWESAICKWKR